MKFAKRRLKRQLLSTNSEDVRVYLEKKIDPFVQKYLKPTRYKRGVVNTMAGEATAKALTKRYPLSEEDHLELGKSCAQSFLRRLGFVCRMNTTGEMKITVGIQKEAELTFLHQIVNNVEKQQIPSSLTINFDQTPSKYVQV